MNRATRRRAGVIGAASLLTLTLGTVGPTATGRALGAVVAITPYEVIPGETIGLEFNPSLSSRGEVAGVFELVDEVGFVFLDTPGSEPMQDGLGIAVSGDSCVALWARENGSPDDNQNVSIGITNRCVGFERELLRTNLDYRSGGGLALSFDGRFGVAVLPRHLEDEFGSNAVVRIDTENGAYELMPSHDSPYFGWAPELGVDISDDGNVVVATESDSSTSEIPLRDVVVWDVPLNQTFFLNGTPGQPVGSGFPSISGDGRYVSFTSAKPLTGPQRTRGPWVFVTDRAAGSVRLVSPAAEPAYQSSITRDGSQVAYTVGPAGCSYNRQTLTDLESRCPGGRIDVAFSPTPGFTTPPAVETVSILADGNQGGLHVEPALSGNGRWVAWISVNGQALLGSTDPALNGRHAFTRRRDPGLVIDPVDFGTLGPNDQSTRSATVRNSGVTSASLDAITATPGRFTIQGGGTCIGGSSLPPGATCTVNVRFAAPNNTSQTTGSITVAEVGYDAISASGRLTGRSSVIPVDEPVTTPLDSVTIPPTTGPGTPITRPQPTTGPGTPITRPQPTTGPGTPITRPQPTITPTTPGQVVLTADPSPLDYGPVAVGIGSPIKTLTITNIGTGTGQLITELEGANPTDFFVANNGCNELVLAANQSCTMEIMMIPLAGGTRSALLTLTASGVSGGVDLLGEGHFAPQLLTSPAAITTRGITTIIGRGFPPGGTFAVRIGTTGEIITATADPAGVFRIPYSAIAKLELGHYFLEVDPLPGVFDLVRGQLNVVLPTFEPQGPGGPAFGESLIVTRGGG